MTAALDGSALAEWCVWLTPEQLKKARELARRLSADPDSAHLSDDERRFCEGIDLLETSIGGMEWHPRPLGDGGAQIILSVARVKLWPSLPTGLRKVDAVMGVDMSKRDLDAMQSRAHVPLTAGEIGILKSNEAAWQHALSAGWEWCLVLEDDAVIQLPGGVERLLALLPCLVEAAGVQDPDWQLLTLSPYGLEDFFATMDPERIPSLHAPSMPAWHRQPQRIGVSASNPQGSGWRRIGPTFHAFGWIYRAPLMRALVEAMPTGTPPLNPLDVWVWEVLAERRWLGRALSPDLIDADTHARLASSTDRKERAVAEMKAAIVSTRIMPGGGDSLRGYNEGTDLESLKQNLSKEFGGDLGANGLASLLKSMVHMLPPDMQEKAKAMPLEQIAASLESPEHANGQTPAINKYLDNQAANAPQTLVALLASDLAHPMRVDYLSACLQSIAEQTTLPARLILAVSAAPEVYADARDLMHRIKAQLEPRGCAVRVRLSKTRLSQFEHYAAVLPYLDALNGHATWLLFSDDDDLWHPRRVESYAAAIASAPPGLVSMHAPVYAVNAPDATETLPLRADQTPGSSTQLAARVRYDGLTINRSDQRRGTDNYWSVTTKLSQWRSYFETTPTEELKSIYSDVHYCLFTFPSMLDAAGQNVRPETLVKPLGGDSNWMYLWRQDHAGNPQHTERQKSKLRPLMRSALERHFARPSNQARFQETLEVLARETDTLPSVVAPFVAGSAPMVDYYLESMVRAETTIELMRVSLRPGFMNVEQALYSEKVAAQEPLNDALRTALFPEAARIQRLEQEARKKEQDLVPFSDALYAHTRAAVYKYKRARLEAMATRGHRYEEVNVDVMAEACSACGL